MVDKNESKTINNIDFYKIIFEHSNDAIFFIDAKTGYFLDVNEKACSRLLYTKEELLKMKVTDIETCIPENISWNQQAQQMKKQKSLILKGMHKKKDGVIFPVEVSLTFYSSIHYDYIIALARDVSEIQESRSVLEITERRFRTFFEQSKVGMAICFLKDPFSLDTMDIEYNPVFYSFLGYEKNELAHISFSDIIHNEDKEIDLIMFKQVIKEKRKNYDVEKRFVRKNGKTVWGNMHVTLSKDNENTSSTLIITVVDITAKRRMETELLHSSQKWQKTFDSINDMLFILDKDNKIAQCNMTIKKFFNTIPSKIIGSYFYTLFPNDGYELTGPFFSQQSTRIPKKPRIKVFPINEKWIEMRSNPIFSYKEISGTVLILTDITERYKLFEELKESQIKAVEADQTKSEFLANMSHEIRTPLNGIIGGSEILLNTNLTEDQKKYLQIIVNSGKILLALINDILDFSKLESGKFTLEKCPFNLEHLLDSTVAPFLIKTTKKNIPLKTDIQQNNLKSLIGDPMRLRQVLTNLIGNAVKFSEKGTVTISVKKIIQTPLNKNLDSQTLTLIFSIKDEGIGISPCKIDKIFNSFSQADSSTSRFFGGTGLGLSICKQIVTLMGGKIWVDSVEGYGSTFIFTANFEQTDEIETIDTIPQKKVFLLVSDDGPRKILLAEDDEMNKKITTIILKKRGFEVVTAKCGREVISLLKKKKFDLILMDIQMPHMDGYQTCEYIRNSKSAPFNQIPIIALTAYTMEKDIQMCRSVKMDGYISKPATGNDLLSIILEVWEKKVKKGETIFLH